MPQNEQEITQKNNPENNSDGKFSVQNLKKSFGSVEVLKGINLEVEIGTFLVLVGPSGCGKSTLLNLIGGLESVGYGHIYMDGQLLNPLKPKDRDMAMVFQSYALYPSMNVYKNISFGLSMQKVAKEEQKEIIQRVAKTLHIEDLLKRKPSQLSGGQRQRVAMARAIARNPRLFLFDEPLSNLDAKLRLIMRKEIKELHQKFGITSIYVTHDQVEAMVLGNVIAVMDQGEIQQMGTPQEIYDNPNNIFVAGFIGSPPMNFIPCSLKKDKGNISIELESGNQTFSFPMNQQEVSKTLEKRLLTGKERVILGLRPENIAEALNKTKDLLKAKVHIIEPTGADTYVNIYINSTDVIARVQAENTPILDKLTTFSLNLSKAVFFDPETKKRIR